jgi:rhamnopyranosyl-N-acetylglucosaminyl-diphospho-decaprenol beta-1,3/1,4-galactofuranosyltransferase
MDRQNQPKILVSVVTRDRPLLLHKLIGILVKQTMMPAEILVVDNQSKDDTRQIVQEWQDRHPMIKYLNTGRNAGSGGGQHTAMAYAMAKGFDAVYTMDDDCEPTETAFEEIVRYWLGIEDRGRWVLSSIVKHLDSDRLAFGVWSTQPGLPQKPVNLLWTIEEIPECHRRENFFPNWGNFFNGVLVPIRVMKIIGLPKPEFFIRGDELEYYYRIARFCRAGIVLSSVVRHPHDDDPLNAGTLAPWKQYYSLRNHIIIGRWYFPSVWNSKGFLQLQMVLKMIKNRLLHKRQNVVQYFPVKDAINEFYGRDILRSLNERNKGV